MEEEEKEEERRGGRRKGEKIGIRQRPSAPLP